MLSVVAIMDGGKYIRQTGIGVQSEGRDGLADE